MKSNTIAVLASYATYKELYSKYPTQNRILAEFIKYIIYNERLHSFNESEMQSKLHYHFGFSLPLSVVRSALKKASFVKKKGPVYTVGKIDQDDISSRFTTEINESQNIGNLLVDFAKNKNLEFFLDESKLIKEFIEYLVDDTNGGEYQEIISEFIFKNSENKEIKNKLDEIREGSVLLTGLNFNITEFGSVTSDLTLYFDVEVLFGLAGYNGEIFKKLADDLFTLIKHANSKQEKIHLRYFKDIKFEINAFFKTAEYIVDGKEIMYPNTAMSTIVNGCENPSDVAVKKSDFFNLLKENGIYEDEVDNYYLESDYEYNLEGMDLSSESIEDYQEGLKYISHINKLREGEFSNEYSKSSYLFVSNTSKVIKTSQYVINLLTEDKQLDYRPCEFAVTSNKLTNYLWTKLNMGFSKEAIPLNIDSVIKARTVLSSNISQKALETFTKSKQQFIDREISKDAFLNRVIALREKNEKPEDLTSDNIDDALDFSEAYIIKYQGVLEQRKAELAEKNQQITELEKQAEYNKEKNTTLIQSLETKNAQLSNENEEQKKISEEKQNRINELERQLDGKNKKERREKIEKNRRNRIIKFIILIIVWFFILIFIIYFLNKCIYPYFSNDMANFISWLASIVAILPLILTLFKKLYKNMKADLENYDKDMRKL